MTLLCKIKIGKQDIHNPREKLLKIDGFACFSSKMPPGLLLGTNSEIGPSLYGNMCGKFGAEKISF